MITATYHLGAWKIVAQESDGKEGGYIGRSYELVLNGKSLRLTQLDLEQLNKLIGKIIHY